MADNIYVDPGVGAGKVLVRTRDNAGVHTAIVDSEAGSLALETGGNLAAIKAKTDNIPAQGQALAAASLPVVLTAAQVTTLTPPAAITGFLTESDFDSKAGALTETAPATDTASSGLNGRLQRIAQRLTSLIALLPAALTGSGNLKAAIVESTATVTVTGPLTDTQLRASAVPVSLASVPSHAVTNAGTFAVQAAEADGANVTLGAKADAKSAATDTTAVTIMQVLKQISEAGQGFPNSAVSGTTSAMTGTTSTSLVAAPGANLRNYISTIIVSNAHATVNTDVVIQDGSGGTTLLTIPAACLYGGAVVTFPTPLRQPTANTALYCACVTTGSSTKVSAVGFKAA